MNFNLFCYFVNHHLLFICYILIVVKMSLLVKAIVFLVRRNTKPILRYLEKATNNKSKMLNEKSRWRKLFYILGQKVEDDLLGIHI